MLSNFFCWDLCYRILFGYSFVLISCLFLRSSRFVLCNILAKTKEFCPLWPYSSYECIVSIYGCTVSWNFKKLCVFSECGLLLESCQPQTGHFSSNKRRNEVVESRSLLLILSLLRNLLLSRFLITCFSPFAVQASTWSE